MALGYEPKRPNHGLGAGKLGELMARQIEFSLSVAVCAWCRPGDLGTALGSVSHGICPKHLRKIRLDLLRTDGTAPTRSHRRTRVLGTEALLFATPVVPQVIEAQRSII